MRLFFLVFLFVFSSCYAQNGPSKEDQIAAAVLAAPEEFRNEATVLGYGSDGSFTTLRKGTNSMICLADDPNKKGFSVAAYHSDLEPFMARGRELRAEGKSGKEVFNIREEESKSGKIKIPKGATLHILSGSDGKYDPNSGKVNNAIYRYVVYLPWATTDETGIPEVPSTSGGPWIMNAGTHKAHIMINPPASSQ